MGRCLVVGQASGCKTGAGRYHKRRVFGRGHVCIWRDDKRYSCDIGGTDMKKKDQREATSVTTLTVRKQEIPVTTKYLLQTSLKFFPENPRIYSLVRSDGKEPTQPQIYDRLLEQEHVKQLVQDIRRNGGLIEPLLVRDGSMEVLEGNSRLAAYRYLAKTDNPIT